MNPPANGKVDLDKDATIQDPTGMTCNNLANAIEDVNLSINLLFNNQFLEAKELTAKRRESSMYHAVGYSSLLFIEAAMTFDAKDIENTMASIKKSLKLCERFRRKQNVALSVGKLLGILSQSKLTEEECHAELIFAELSLFRAALTFIQDENLISFIRGALQVRQCYQAYSFCLKILEKMEHTQHSIHFIGVNTSLIGSLSASVEVTSKGLATRNMLVALGLSLLPPRILSLLEWVGFSCDKHKGMEQLLEGYSTPNLRTPLTTLIILSYNLFVTVHFGTHDCNLEQAETILKGMLRKFPNGVFFHLHAGRLEQLNGNFDEAIAHLEKAVSLQTQWKSFYHICYWELMWCQAYKLDWVKAAEYAALLKKESNWSKCVYTYLRAAFLIMLKSNDYHDEINNLMREVPMLKQRFAGKSIPSEKFVARKARKFLEQDQSLVLPAHEMLYAWNGLLMLKGNPEIRAKHRQLLTDTFNNVQNKTNNSTPSTEKQCNYYDDYCLMQLLKGTCLRFDNELQQAEACFNDVKENYRRITKDHYLAPAALSDLSWMFIEQGRTNEAGELLKYTRKTYSHYSMESRIHFRMHAAQARLNETLAKASSSKSK